MLTVQGESVAFDIGWRFQLVQKGQGIVEMYGWTTVQEKSNPEEIVWEKSGEGACSWHLEGDADGNHEVDARNIVTGKRRRKEVDYRQLDRQLRSKENAARAAVRSDTPSDDEGDAGSPPEVRESKSSHELSQQHRAQVAKVVKLFKLWMLSTRTKYHEDRLQRRGALGTNLPVQLSTEAAQHALEKELRAYNVRVAHREQGTVILIDIVARQRFKEMHADLWESAPMPSTTTKTDSKHSQKDQPSKTCEKTCDEGPTAEAPEKEAPAPVAPAPISSPTSTLPSAPARVLSPVAPAAVTPSAPSAPSAQACAVQNVVAELSTEQPSAIREGRETKRRRLRKAVASSGDEHESATVKAGSVLVDQVPIKHLEGLKSAPQEVPDGAELPSAGSVVAASVPANTPAGPLDPIDVGGQTNAAPAESASSPGGDELSGQQTNCPADPTTPTIADEAPQGLASATCASSPVKEVPQTGAQEGQTQAPKAAAGAARGLEEVQSEIDAQPPPEKAYHLLVELAKIEVEPLVLARTKIGATVNRMRKHYKDHQQIVSAAAELVGRWKSTWLQQREQQAAS